MMILFEERNIYAQLLKYYFKNSIQSVIPWLFVYNMHPPLTLDYEILGKKILVYNLYWLFRICSH